MPIVKRAVSLLLVVALCLGFLPIISPPTPVQAVATWTKATGNPVLVDGAIISDPCVIFDQDAGIYKMWYSKSPATTTPLDTLLQGVLTLGTNFKIHLAARNFTSLAADQHEAKAMITYLAGQTPAQLKTALQSAASSIAYATSADGIHWTLHSGGFNADPASDWSGLGVSSPSVIKTAPNSYEMWYNGMNIDTTALQNLFIHLNLLSEAQIHQVLTDLLVARDFSAVIGDLSAIHVTDTNSSLAYTLITDVLLVAGGSVASVGYAHSADGLTWSGQTRVITPGDIGNYDVFGAYFPSVVSTPAGYSMWYSGVGINASAVLSFIGAGSITFDSIKSFLADNLKITICRADTTSLGAPWTKTGTVISNSTAPYSAVFAPSVIRLSSGTYEMWLTQGVLDFGSLLDVITGAGTVSEALAAQDVSILKETSTDGTAWLGPISIISKGDDGEWDAQGVGFPCVIQNGPIYNLWYTGVKTDAAALVDNILTAPTPTISGAIAASGTQSAIGLASGTPVHLASISVTAAASVTSVAAGRALQFTATGTNSDSSSAGNITSSVTWDTSDHTKATINSAGLLTGLVAGGPITVSALKVNEIGITVTGTTTLTITPPELVSIEVTPVDAVVGIGHDQQYQANGHYSDTSIVDLTSGAGHVTWSAVPAATAPGAATITSGGKATGTALGNVIVTATLGLIHGATTLHVVQGSLDSIAITPVASSVAAGRTLQFTATGTYKVGSTVTGTADITGSVSWSGSDATKAAFNTPATPGLISGLVAGGPITISALQGAVTGSTTLIIGPPVLDSITVAPTVAGIPLGYDLQYSAQGNYSDYSTQDITNSVIWSAAPAVATPGTATITVGGKATGTAVGDVNVTATLGSVTSPAAVLHVLSGTLSSITVTSDSASIASGLKNQFHATGHYSGGATADITDSVNWSSNSTSVADFKPADPPGKITGLVAGGPITITASLNGIPGTITFTVTAASVASLSVLPLNPVVTVTQVQQFQAWASYSDGTVSNVTAAADCHWTVTSGTSATVSDTTPNKGKATASATITGNTTIQANYGGKTAYSVMQVINAVLDHITVSINTGTKPVPAGQSVQFKATGYYNDVPPTTADLSSYVTWASSAPANVSINGSGLATGLVNGTSSNITASIVTPAITSVPYSLAVGPAVLTALEVTPQDPSLTLIAGATQTLQFKATAIYSNGSSSDVTGAATWSVISGTSVSVGPANGLATVVSSGNSTVQAVYQTAPAATSVFSVLADTVSPVIVVDQPAGGSTTNAALLTVIGSISGFPDVTGTKPVVVLNGVSTSFTALQLTSLGSGAYSFAVPVTLAVGYNTIVIEAQDTALVPNSASSTTRTIKYDTNKPLVQISAPLDGTLTKNPTIAVTGTASDANSITLVVNGNISSLPVVAGAFNTTVSLSEGLNVIVATAYPTPGPFDAAHQGTSGAKIVIKDSTGPVVAITSPANNSTISQPGIEVTGTVNDPQVTSVSLQLNALAPLSVPVNNGVFSQTLGLSVSGVNTIKASAADILGNASNIAMITINFNTSVPQVSINNPDNNLLTKNSTLVISGTVNDASIQTASLVYNGGASQTLTLVPSATAGIQNFNANVTLVTGVNTFYVAATRGAFTGNSGTFSVTLDNTAPKLTIDMTDPTNSILIAVSSNEALQDSPTVIVNTTPVTSPVTLVMSHTDALKWTGTFSPIPAGDYAVSVQAADIAGNISTGSANFVKKIVTVNPGTPTQATTGAVTLNINTTASVTEPISVAATTTNPSGNVQNPSGSANAAGVFLTIDASANLRNKLSNIYIQVAYDPARLSAGTDESSLRLYLWDVATGNWTQVPGSGVNTVLKYIYGTVTHLSQYGGFGQQVVVPPAPPEIIPGGGTSSVSSPNALNLDVNGKALTASVINNEDGKVTFNVAVGTVLKSSSGAALLSLTASVNPQPPQAPAGTAIIVDYTFHPAGAIFSPGLGVTMKYALPLPAGVNESALYMAYWDGTVWQKLASTVDTVNKTVSSNVPHFTEFAIIGQLPAPVTPAPTTVAPTTVPPTTAPPTTVPPTTAPPTSVPPTTNPPATTPPTTVPTSAAPVATAPPPGPNWVMIIPIIVVIAVLLTVILMIMRRRTP